MRRALASTLVVACVLGTSFAQQQSERSVQVLVTAASGRDVFLDQGRDAGLRPGQLVRLFPPGMGNVDVEVRAVTATQSRAELPVGLPPVPVGTRGEAIVEVRAETAPPATTEQRTVPEHPPWTRREPSRSADQPLLVPTFSQHPNARPATIDGRWFASGQWSRDTAGEQHNDYLLARLGVRADATNLLGRGERTRFAGELAERRVQLPDAPDETDQNGRLDLLSVAFGTEQWAPVGAELGRFLSQHLPEIGLVDGVEVVQRFDNGVRIGGGAGAYPRPFPSRETGEDTGLHVFADWTSDAERSFAAAVGFQKTWHEGTPDRDLLLLRAEGRVFESVRWFASSKIDFYSSGDDVKSASVEITEAFASLSYDGGGFGAGLTGSHFRWPDLDRAEYQNLPVELVRDGEVDRVALQAWVRPWQRLRIAPRVDAWSDQTRSGTAYAIDGDLADVIGAQSNLYLSLFRADGAHSAGPGARATLRAPIGDGTWRAGYRWHRYELDELATGPESLTRQSAEIGLSHPVADGGDVDFSVERWFGDREDAWAVGLWLQWRF